MNFYYDRVCNPSKELSKELRESVDTLFDIIDLLINYAENPVKENEG